MNLVDVHTHLTHEAYTDIDQVIKRATQEHLKVIFVSGVNPQDNRLVLSLVKKYPLLKASFGIYPIDALGLDEEGNKGEPIDLEKEFAFIEEHKDLTVCIGEIGMDFKYGADYKQEQEDNFRQIIRFAKKIKKPILIHSRKAEKECVTVLSQEVANREIPIVQHCFSGKKKILLEAIKLGHYFSIPANCVKSQHFQMMINLVPFDQLLTETDAPYLSADGSFPNEPSQIKHSIAMIAQIKEVSLEEAAKRIWANYCRVFSPQPL